MVQQDLLQFVTIFEGIFPSAPRATRSPGRAPHSQICRALAMKLKDVQMLPHPPDQNHHFVLFWWVAPCKSHLAPP